MQVQKIVSVSLITCDPFFSVWSPHDKLTDGDTAHWSGIKQAINGYLTIDGHTHCFLGSADLYTPLEQISLAITATRTIAVFDHPKLTLTVTFTTPLILDNPALASRPLTYIDCAVDKKADCDATVHFKASADLVKNDHDKVIGGAHVIDDINYASMAPSTSKG